MVKAFKERHGYVVKRLNEMPGVNALESDGTFYTFPSFRDAMRMKGISSDTALAEMFLEAGVALVPGSAFGAEGYARISFATSMEALQSALDRLNLAIS